MAKTDITAARLRERLIYDPETGVFTWRPRGNPQWDARFANQIAGSFDPGGYVRLIFDYEKCWAHRLAWLYVNGEWPLGDIDHIDGNPRNNRISNLRDVPRSTNMENRRRANSKGNGLPLGVYFDKRRETRPFVARLTKGYRAVHLGSFASADEAHSAYLQAKRQMHVGCTI